MDRTLSVGISSLHSGNTPVHALHKAAPPLIKPNPNHHPFLPSYFCHWRHKRWKTSQHCLQILSLNFQVRHQSMETDQCRTDILVMYPNILQAAGVLSTGVASFTHLQEKTFSYNGYGQQFKMVLSLLMCCSSHTNSHRHLEKLRTPSIWEFRWAGSWVSDKPEVTADINLHSDSQGINTEECVLLRFANLGFFLFLVLHCSSNIFGKRHILAVGI